MRRSRRWRTALVAMGGRRVFALRKGTVAVGDREATRKRPRGKRALGISRDSFIRFTTTRRVGR